MPISGSATMPSRLRLRIADRSRHHADYQLHATGALFGRAAAPKFRAGSGARLISFGDDKDSIREFGLDVVSRPVPAVDQRWRPGPAFLHLEPIRAKPRYPGADIDRPAEASAAAVKGKTCGAGRAAGSVARPSIGQRRQAPAFHRAETISSSPGLAALGCSRGILEASAHVKQHKQQVRSSPSRNKPAQPQTAIQSHFRIPVGKLTLGMWVAQLDRPWVDTPFLIQGFEIDSDSRAGATLRHCCKFV